MVRRDVVAKFSSRIEALPKNLQRIFFSDLETAIESRLQVLEGIKQ